MREQSEKTIQKGERSMKKTIAAVLTALAMVVALVLPMTAFADDKTPQNVKPYEEKFEATGTEKDYDVVVEDFEEEDVTVEEAADEDVSLKPGSYFILLKKKKNKLFKNQMHQQQF